MVGADAMSPRHLADLDARHERCRHDPALGCLRPAPPRLGRRHDLYKPNGLLMDLRMDSQSNLPPKPSRMPNRKSAGGAEGGAGTALTLMPMGGAIYWSPVGQWRLRRSPVVVADAGSTLGIPERFPGAGGPTFMVIG